MSWLQPENRKCSSFGCGTVQNCLGHQPKFIFTLQKRTHAPSNNVHAHLTSTRTRIHTWHQRAPAKRQTGVDPRRRILTNAPLAPSRTSPSHRRWQLRAPSTKGQRKTDPPADVFESKRATSPSTPRIRRSRRYHRRRHRLFRRRSCWSCCCCCRCFCCCCSFCCWRTSVVWSFVPFPWCRRRWARVPRKSTFWRPFEKRGIFWRFHPECRRWQSPRGGWWPRSTEIPPEKE